LQAATVDAAAAVAADVIAVLAAAQNTLLLSANGQNDFPLNICH